MKLKDLITDANRALYEAIRNSRPVQLRPSDDESWHSDLNEKRALIYYGNADNGPAAFTRELLHLDLQLEGYRRLRAGVSLHYAVYELLPVLCLVINNELEDHKIFQRFLELGYSSEDFHSDATPDIEAYVRSGISVKGQTLTSIIRIYFMLISPGNPMPTAVIETLKEKFREYDDGAFRERFEAIDLFIAAWKIDPDYNSENYAKDLLNIMGCHDSWISYVADPKDFPDDGFFTSKPFRIEDIDPSRY